MLILKIEAFFVVVVAKLISDFDFNLKEISY